MENYDIIVIGSGPGGYTAAIRSAQLGKRTAIVECAEIGGVCLNWGCIPSKALLKSAQVYAYARNFASYGVELQGNIAPDLQKMVERSRGVVAQMGRGVELLLGKNGVDIYRGKGILRAGGIVEVAVGGAGAPGSSQRECTPRPGLTASAAQALVVPFPSAAPDDPQALAAQDTTTQLAAPHIILATGARSRQLPAIPVDGKRVVDYHGAMMLQKIPASMIIVGSGAIGCEFAWIYSTLGAKVTLVELLPRILPLEDGDMSKEMARAFRKRGIEMLVSTSVHQVQVADGSCVVTLEAGGQGQSRAIEAETVLSAVGVQPNIENLGLEELDVATERGKVKVDELYRTNIAGIYAIGDLVPGPALAHVAAAEAICCVEAICGLEPKAVDYSTIPSCVYTSPEVASVGLTGEEAAAQGIAVKVGMFPFMASGKAAATGEREGFVKLIFDAATEKLLGAHAVGANVSEIIGELALAKSLGATADTIMSVIHSHPTFYEAIAEAAAAAKGRAINI